jgi:hypothetical protein
MRSSNDHRVPTVNLISVKAATKATSIQSDTKKIKESWDAFRSADTVRLSVRRKHTLSYAPDIVQASESLPMTSVASILLEEEIQALAKKSAPLG